MYEPVSDQCVTSTIINPRYSSNRAGIYDRTCNNTTESECCADCVVPPEKPPRKCKPQHFQQGKPYTYDFSSFHTNRNRKKIIRMWRILIALKTNCSFHIQL